MTLIYGMTIRRRAEFGCAGIWARLKEVKLVWQSLQTCPEDKLVSALCQLPTLAVTGCASNLVGCGGDPEGK